MGLRWVAVWLLVSAGVTDSAQGSRRAALLSVSGPSHVASQGMPERPEHLCGSCPLTWRPGLGGARTSAPGLCSDLLKAAPVHSLGGEGERKLPLLRNE